MLCALFASGCAVPLAPGYKAIGETRTVRFAAGSPRELQINESYKLKNTGTTPLPFIDLNIPEAQAFGTKDLRVEYDGHPANLEELPAKDRQDHPDTRRIAFEQPWQRGATHELNMKYSLSSPGERGARVAIGNETFHLGALGWAVLPQPPHHFLSSYPRRPDKMTYTVVVPSDFRVLARGKLIRRKDESTNTAYQFQLQKDDLAPFVVAGRYIETPFGTGPSGVIFWTLHPLQESPGSTPQRISRAWTTLEGDFGALDLKIRGPHVVEAPNLRSPLGEGPAVASFPGGALVNEQTLALGIRSDAFFEEVSHALAYNWFRDEMYPSADASLGIGEGLPEYATIVIDEASGGAKGRRRRIEYYLNRYQNALKRGQEKPLGVTTLSDPPPQRAIALAKAPLMYVDLEDTCGEKTVRDGLKDLVTLLRGQEVGFDDMRSAMEQRCGKDLGGFFRTWLYGRGLPANFEARYASGNAGP
jgi:hypothetical protein